MSNFVRHAVFLGEKLEFTTRLHYPFVLRLKLRCGLAVAHDVRDSIPA